MNALVLDTICKSFGDVQAVDALSVCVPTGSIYGFLGPNGAGKTTTIRLIMNIIQPDSGRISILGDGKNHGALDRIGYMPEERGLYRKMTVAKVLAYFGGIKGIPKRELARRVPYWLERLELADRADKKVEELSRGMHQKLQFAVTVIHEPDLLILDEPFSGLDPVNLDRIKEIILEMKRQGKTIIFSTHVMHEAEALCDYHLLINKGRLVVNGTLDEIRRRWKSDAVVARLDGDSEFIRDLPMVQQVKRQNNHVEITLTEQADPQELLRALVEKVRVDSFEVKLPSLHEIFVRLVRPDDAAE
ncbi:MAG: ATP-binding cassette domain-containing protein [Sedimentisphaerales bacterium]|nr:ATP-binding cassette domain-containing protein [Sedimentisphaerales bacterium]